METRRIEIELPAEAADLVDQAARNKGKSTRAFAARAVLFALPIDRTRITTYLDLVEAHERKPGAGRKRKAP